MKKYILAVVMLSVMALTTSAPVYADYPNDSFCNDVWYYFLNPCEALEDNGLPCTDDNETWVRSIMLGYAAAAQCAL